MAGGGGTDKERHQLPAGAGSDFLGFVYLTLAKAKVEIKAV